MMYILGSENADPEGKVFVRQIDDRSFSLGDFRLPVYHKRQRKWVQRKDLGQKMSVPMIGQGPVVIARPHKGALSVLSWYKGMDEKSGQIYSYLHRVNQNAIDHINDIFGTEIVSEKDSGIVKVSGVGDSTDSSDIMSTLFVLQLLWGRRESRDAILHGIKVIVPLISSTMHYQSVIEEMVKDLREVDIVIKMDVIENNDGVVMQLSSRDVYLLDQFVLWYKPLASWDVISTKDVTNSLTDSLVDFLGKEVVLGDNQMIKIGSVQ